MVNTDASQRVEARIEVFPFERKDTITSNKPQTMMENRRANLRQNVSPSQDAIVVLPTEASHGETTNIHN